MKNSDFRKRCVCSALLALGISTQIEAKQLRVTVQNLTPENGLNLTPFWLAFHDGSFDVYDRSVAASAALESLAEDGNTAPISALFSSLATPGSDLTLTEPSGFTGAPVFDPGSSATVTMEVDETVARYFSYASMVIPSNDAFIANGDPKQHELFDASGQFKGPISFTVWGTDVLDAGTELNSETDAAFLNQSSGNTGATENGVVTAHPGFNGSVGNPAATPVNILGGTNVAGSLIDTLSGDFSRANYQLARITITDTEVPVRVNVSNLSQSGGLYNTPLWVGFHSGQFDTYDRGQAASAGLERIAEDGDAAQLSTEFSTAESAGLDSVITEPSGFSGAPVFDPGSKTKTSFSLNPANHRYFSYATMLIPSNDAFVANGNPMAHQLFDANGEFSGPVMIMVNGSQVLDAGTEVNSETDAAFLNQTAGNTGQNQNGVVETHPGFNGSSTNPAGVPQNILGGTNAAGTINTLADSDFSAAGSQLLRISVNRAVDWSFSGAWYDSDRDGEGFVMVVTGDHQHPMVTLTWYTYTNDGSGQPLWLIGSAPVLGETAIIEMFQAEGAQFGSDFNSSDVNKPYWGQIQVNFTDCNVISANYDGSASGYGTGTVNVVRLTANLSNKVGACQ